MMFFFSFFCMFVWNYFLSLSLSLSLFFSLSSSRTPNNNLYIHSDSFWFLEKIKCELFYFILLFTACLVPCGRIYLFEISFLFCDSFWVEVSPSLESTQDFALCQGYMDTYARGIIVRKIRETLIAYLIPTSTCVHTASYLCRLERSLPFFISNFVWASIVANGLHVVFLSSFPFYT